MRSLSGLSLRARLMIVGVTGVAVALAAGSILMYQILTFAVDRILDNEALAGAQGVAAMVDEDRLPIPIPVSGAQLIQVVDSQGRVVGGSAGADRLVPLLRPAELELALRGAPVVVRGSRAGISGPLRVRALEAGPAQDRKDIIFAVQIGDVLTGRAVLRNTLLVIVPLLVAGLAAIAWRVIGWTLRPVETLRLGAERISGRDRQERLPVPRTADEIRALAVTLNGMLDRLAAGRARQQSFVADAAHELRSPLASIRTQLEVAEHLREGGSLPADLQVDVARLSALVEDLLLLARADADSRGPANPTTFDGRTLLAEVADAFKTARVPVTVSPGPSVSVSADRDELRRAVANLVDNSVRHARSQVRLGALIDDSSVVLSVEDDGPGIPASERERVFDRFTRLDDARDRDAGGSGLGLAIVRELVTRAGGIVGFASTPGHAINESGTAGILRAQIRLPVAHTEPGVTWSQPENLTVDDGARRS